MNVQSNKPKTQDFFLRFHKWLLLVVLIAAPFCFHWAGIVLTPRDMSSFVLDVSHWLPQNSRMIEDLEKFSEVIGKERQNVVRISWPFCKEDDPRIHQYVDLLKKEKWPDELQQIVATEKGIDVAELDPNIFDDVVTLSDVMAEMRAADQGLSDEQIKAQVSGVLIGSNGTTCVLGVLPTRIPSTRKYALDRALEIGKNVPDLGRAQIKSFGGPVYTSQIDESGAQLGLYLTPLSAVISMLAAWYCLKNFWLIFCVCFNAIMSTAWAIASLHLTSAPIDPLLMLLPAFWMVMAMSAGIHFVNYYLDSSTHADSDAALVAVKTAWRPTLLAVLTTCVGLGSLCTSDILPVYRFGLHAVIGLFFSTTILFCLLPSLLTLFRNRLPTQANNVSETQRWNEVGDSIIKLGTKPAWIFLPLLVFTAFGFSKLEFSNKLNDQFKGNIKVKRDAAWFEEEIGPLLPFEILVRFDESVPSRLVDRLNFVAELQQRLDKLKYPVKTVSATSIISKLPGGSGIRQATRRAVAEARLKKHLGSLKRNGFVVQEDKTQLWRLTVLTYDSEPASMNQYFSEIRGVVEDFVTTENPDLNGVDVSYAGIGARMATITQKLGGGLAASCVYTVLLISLIVILSLRSITLGLTAMIPNVFPVVISFGAFGWLNPRLDIGSIMTASIAMGIAVDDTIHFLYWFRKGLTESLGKSDAIKLAIQKCGRAIFSTSLICGLGFVVFLFSSFMPAARFGSLLFVMLCAALIGDLILLPALLLLLPENLFRRAQSNRIATNLMASHLNSSAS